MNRLSVKTIHEIQSGYRFGQNASLLCTCKWTLHFPIQYSFYHQIENQRLSRSLLIQSNVRYPFWMIQRQLMRIKQRYTAHYPMLLNFLLLRKTKRTKEQPLQGIRHSSIQIIRKGVVETIAKNTLQHGTTVTISPLSEALFSPKRISCFESIDL